MALIIYNDLSKNFEYIYIYDNRLLMGCTNSQTDDKNRPHKSNSHSGSTMKNSKEHDKIQIQKNIQQENRIRDEKYLE